MTIEKNVRILSAFATSLIVLSVAASPVYAAQNNSLATKVLPSPTTENAAIQFRANLDNLLGEHTVLAVLVMEKIYIGAPDANVLVDSLNQNTDRLANTIQSVYGTSEAEQFKMMWKGHINHLIAYVKAAKRNDNVGEQNALDALYQYRAAFSKFIASATGLPQTTISNKLQVYVNQLITTFNDYKNKNYTASDKELATAYNNMFQMGDGISKSIVQKHQNKFGDINPETPAANLRIRLDELLGDHANLTLLAMYAEYDGAADYKSLTNQLSKNTNQLTSAIQAIYGDTTAQRFRSMWQNHISDFAKYVQATAKQNKRAQQTALNNLAQFRTSFSKFISTGTGLPSTEVASSVRVYVRQLIGSFNDHVNKNYNAQWNEYVKAYHHTFSVDAALSSTIVSQMPNRFASSSDRWNWASMTIDVNESAVSRPLSVWGINPKNRKSARYVPIWYIMKALKQVGVESKWNGNVWRIMASSGMKTNRPFDGYTDAIVVNGKTLGRVDALTTKDPYGMRSTTYMAAADVTKILAAAGVTSSWQGSTLHIQ